MKILSNFEICSENKGGWHIMAGGMTSFYFSIAVDIARRIGEEELSIGAKISGRTVLASQYQVSPETIRKAIALLREAGAVEVSRGKEIEVVSKEKAKLFLAEWDASKPVQSFWEDFDALVAEKKRIDQKFYQMVEEIANRSPRVSTLVPYRPFEIQIKAETKIVGKTIGQLRLWQATGATVVAVRRKEEFIVSPGPDVGLEAGDWLVLVGPEDSIPKMQEMF